jgi:hypothetical protein
VSSTTPLRFPCARIAPPENRKALPLCICYLSFGALSDRVEGHELRNLVPIQHLGGLHPPAHRLVDVVLAAFLRGQGAGQDQLVGELGLEQDRVAEGQDVLGQRPGLVRAENVDPRQLLYGLEPRDDGLLPRQRLGPRGSL